ncbi:hypothetical protein Hanom_Chr16g01449681 [Helianthus anomalus]
MGIYTTLLRFSFLSTYLQNFLSSSSSLSLKRVCNCILFFIILMSTGDHPKDTVDEMSSSLPPLKCWAAICPKEGQKATQAPAGYITLFSDYFVDGNFRLPTTKFVFDILGYYKFHLSQLHPMGMDRIRHFEFLCQSIGIEPLVDRFRLFYKLHCSLGFYSFMQRSLVKKILLTPLKSFHEWKSEFFFIKSGVISVKMEFRSVEEILPENLDAPVTEIWYQNIKEIPSIQLPERAFVAAKMSLFWRGARHDKPLFVEDKTDVALYVVAYQREKGKMTTL